MQNFLNNQIKLIDPKNWRFNKRLFEMKEPDHFSINTNA